MAEAAFAVSKGQLQSAVANLERARQDLGEDGDRNSRILQAQAALDQAVARALSKVDLDETLVIVTADHGHVLSFSGYPRRGNPILGKVVEPDATSENGVRLARDANNLPYTTLSYANGLGHRSPRQDLADVDTTDVNYLQDATVPLASETHSGTDVIVFADGPGADLFRGVHEQNYVYHVMRHAVSKR